MPLIIGATMGAINGYMIADAKGLKGWDKFGYVVGGATIGAASAAIGVAGSGLLTPQVGAGLASILSGSVAGGFNSLMFAQMSGNHKNEGLGFLTGAVGAGISGYIGGGKGAFLGGAASSALGSYINGERDPAKLMMTSLISGGLSYGSWELNMAMSYPKTKDLGIDLSYNEYKQVCKGTQRAFFRGGDHEFGAIRVDGKFHTVESNNGSIDFQQFLKENSIIEWKYHCHSDKNSTEYSFSYYDPKIGNENNDINTYENSTSTHGHHRNIVTNPTGKIYYLNNSFYLDKNNPNSGYLYQHNFLPQFVPYNIFKY